MRNLVLNKLSCASYHFSSAHFSYFSPTLLIYI
nr:MAG TPA: hypothetical protein [Caudoviricetes sp.]